VPSWSKDGTVKMHTINARAESLTTNNMWRGVVKRKRCLILVNGYTLTPSPSSSLLPDADTG
jgi:putative SOS response-associated peptidase YedK